MYYAFLSLTSPTFNHWSDNTAEMILQTMQIYGNPFQSIPIGIVLKSYHLEIKADRM